MAVASSRATTNGHLDGQPARIDPTVECDVETSQATATLLDTATAAAAAGVKPATVRLWVHRGKLPVAATNPTRYRLADVAAIRDGRRLDNAP